ncbi:MULTISPECIES: transcriptional regulator [unclassified Streptomyces]|uniref:transcriptional regulator n=1 Tax=unclassified Streptomyces TaxID=2593676 RepID=UPI00344C891C
MTEPVSSHATSTDLLVLHTLRCIGFSGLSGVAKASGLPESDVESELIDLAVAGLVTHASGDFGGWGLSEEGRAADAERIAEELAAAGARERVTAVFDQFLVLNPELLDLCTAWQTRTADGTMTMNDHSDRAYDAKVLDRFTEFHQRAEPLCAELSGVLLRFRRYPVRLADALTRARTGSLEYVTDSTSSYHTVWFQLHEDLLATLGLPRH